MGCHLSAPEKTKKTTIGLTSRLHYVAMGMQGWRIDMEDAHIAYKDEINDIYVFGVFDGHGGKEVARFVQKHFTSELLNNKDFLNKNYSQALIETFFRMDELLKSPSRQEELKWLKYDPKEEKDEFFDEVSTAGCTANVVVIIKDELYVANAGDSRSVLSQNGKFIELSIDHKPENPIEKARIYKAGGKIIKRRVCGNLNISRAIGDFTYKQGNIKREEQIITAMPDISITKLDEKSEFILIGCDGIWETRNMHISMDRMREMIIGSKGRDLEGLMEMFLEESLAKEKNERYGYDNMTGVLIVFDKFLMKKKDET